MIQNVGWDVPHGHSLQARCKDLGLYKLLGETRVLCSNGLWAPRMPSCVPTTLLTNFSGNFFSNEYYLLKFVNLQFFLSYLKQMTVLHQSELKLVLVPVLLNHLVYQLCYQVVQFIWIACIHVDVVCLNGLGLDGIEHTTQVIFSIYAFSAEYIQVCNL